MIQITIVTNMGRRVITTSPTSTVREVLTANNVNYSTAQVYLDGTPLEIGDHDRSFNDFGITETCMLSAVVKTTNA